MTAATAPLVQSEGLPYPMGANLVGDGVNFAVFSAHATQLYLCLFDGAGRNEQRIPFAARTGDIWHTHLAGLGAGQLYGLRADGPYLPEQGHRFNVHKLLIDPYTRGLSGRLRWSDALYGYRAGAAKADLSFDTRDSAFAMPKSVVMDTRFDWQGDAPPRRAMADTVIYEAHVKSLTRLHPEIPPALRGTYAGMAHPAMIAHLQRLGVTAVELLPIQAFVDDRFLVEKGLTNHWGYNTIGFFAPDARYAATAAPLREVQTMVRDLHRAGIEVILDVVYNHSAESDQLGPTLAFRGLDNASYYRLSGGGRYYVNDTGTGNTFDATHPATLRLIMDSLRYWVQQVHIDGFRFDLASILGREAHGFDARSGFFDALGQDPVLAGVKLIAEPWDIGPGGYQLGAYPVPFAEWNDRARDTFRRFWRGDAGMVPDLTRRILGSADKFDHSARAPQASVNFITSHDGFTLQDLVSYAVKHNLANGEDGRDGHSDNHSDNMGHEGPDAALQPARDLRKRNLLATLLLSQGVPMLLAGDELGHSQGGNNNAYAQDNETTWLTWTGDDLADFIARLCALRAEHPVLRQKLFLHGRARSDGMADVMWHLAGGGAPTPADWQSADLRCIGIELRMAAQGPDAPDVLYIVLNAGGEAALKLPASVPAWALILDTTRPKLSYQPITAPEITAPACAVLIFKPLSIEAPI
jgi:glycogen operon protein